MARLRKRWTDEDFERFERLCQIQCPLYEICASMGTSADTMKRILAERYGDELSDALGPADELTPGKVVAWFAAKGRAQVRAMVFQQASEGDTALVRELARMYMAGGDEPTKKVPAGGLERFRRGQPTLVKASG